MVVDTNVVVAYFQQSLPGEDPLQVARATDLFESVRVRNLTCVLTPTVFSEILHAYVRKTYKRLIPGNKAALRARHGAQINTWLDLLKADPVPLQTLHEDLTTFRQALTANNLVIIGQEDFDFVTYPLQVHFGEELIDRMVRYGLDSSDAVITMEAARLGIDAIVSMDRDMRRALPDFDIYTWL